MKTLSVNSGLCQVDKGSQLGDPASSVSLQSWETLIGERYLDQFATFNKTDPSKKGNSKKVFFKITWCMVFEHNDRTEYVKITVSGCTVLLTLLILCSYTTIYEEQRALFWVMALESSDTATTASRAPCMTEGDRQVGAQNTCSHKRQPDLMASRSWGH